MPAGYDALRTRAAWIDLTGRGEIFATGEDRARLLHAMSTNHVEQLKPGDGCYAFFLNAQGRIQADANILCMHDRLLIDTEPETREKLLTHLNKYIIADDVTLEDASPHLAVIGVEGPEWGQGSLLALRERLTVPFAHIEWQGGWAANISSTGAPGVRLFLPAERKAQLIGMLEQDGIPQATAEDARIVRLEHGKPRYGDDITDTSLPQETQQMHAVSFNKGCYVGQEIVERIRSQGQVRRVLQKVEYTEGATPEGEITSSAYSPGLGKRVALAYVRTR
jgi:tRNA-modifying protein YgfZ